MNEINNENIVAKDEIDEETVETSFEGIKSKKAIIKKLIISVSVLVFIVLIVIFVWYAMPSHISGTYKNINTEYSCVTKVTFNADGTVEWSEKIDFIVELSATLYGVYEYDKENNSFIIEIKAGKNPLAEDCTYTARKDGLNKLIISGGAHENAIFTK